MPPFDREPETWRGVDWPLLQNGFVTLFSHPQFFADICAQLTAAGYHVVELAAGGWTTEDAAHTAFSSALAFPDYYGRNLDALRDCLGDVATYEYGSDKTSTGTVIAFSGYDAFARHEPRTAARILDILADTGRFAVLFRHRFMVLVQSDDPTIEFEPVGATGVTWLLQERDDLGRIERSRRRLEDVPASARPFLQTLVDDAPDPVATIGTGAHQWRLARVIGDAHRSSEAAGGVPSRIHSVAFGTMSDGRMVLAVGREHEPVRLLDPATGAVVTGPLLAEGSGVDALVFVPLAGRSLLATAWKSTVHLWDPASGIAIGELSAETPEGYVYPVSAVAVGTRADGRALLAAASDQAVHLWDPVTGHPAAQPLTGHTSYVTAVAFGTGAGGRTLLASASWDRTVKLWDVEPTEPEAVLTIPLLGLATAITWSPNGDLIAAATSTQVAVLTASGNQ